MTIESLRYEYELTEGFCDGGTVRRLPAQQLRLNIPLVSQLFSAPDRDESKRELRRVLGVERWYPEEPSHQRALEEVCSGTQNYRNSELYAYASSKREHAAMPVRDFDPRIIAVLLNIPLQPEPSLAQPEMELDGRVYYRPDADRQCQGYAVAHGISHVLMSGTRALHLDVTLFGIALLCDAADVNYAARAYARGQWSLRTAVSKLCRTFRYLPRWAAVVRLVTELHAHHE